MKKDTPSFEIALSAISCAIAAGCLMLGSLYSIFLAAGYLLGSFAVMIPLSRNFLRGAFLCYGASILLSVWIMPVNIVPYVLFFGLHPIVNYLQNRYLRKKVFFFLAEAVKTVWFVMSMWLSYFLLKSFAQFVFPEIVEQYFYLVLFVGGTIFFFLYDFMIFRCQKSADLIIRRLRR